MRPSVKIIASDERVKNEGALAIKIIKRITGESVFVANLKHLVVEKLVKTTRIWKILHDPSDNLNTWREEQKE